MKENMQISKIEKCFDFFKMDKKNVQISKARIFYGKTVECDDKKNLASSLRKNNSKIVTINFS
jgi:hypothetical protein